MHLELVKRIVGIVLLPLSVTKVPNQIVKTIDLTLDQNNLPVYPPLPVNLDAKKIEETCRTLLKLDVKLDMWPARSGTLGRSEIKSNEAAARCNLLKEPNGAAPIAENTQSAPVTY